MSLLEDRLLRIIELRQAGKSHAAVARTLHIPKKSILQYERSVKASLQEVVQEGVGTLGELAAQLKMSRTVTGMAMDYFGLRIPEKEAPPATAQELTEKMQAVPKTHTANISRLASEGKTRKEIAQELSLSYDYVAQLVQQEGITIPHAYRGRSPRLSSQRPRLRQEPSEQALQIKTSLEQGERSLEKLIQQAQSGIHNFYLICRDYNLILPEDIIPYPYRPEFDGGITQGQSIGEIAAATGKSRQLVNLYIKLSGQQYFWEQQRDRRRDRLKQDYQKESEYKKDFQRHFLYLLEQRIDTLAAGNFPLQKAIEYARGHQKKVQNIPLDKLITFFQRYETIQGQGKKHSLQRLSRGLFNGTMAGHLLEYVGLPPLHGNSNMPSRKVSHQKKELILRALSSPLSANDLHYFTNIPAGSIYKYIIQEGGREQKGSTSGIHSFGHKKTREVLTYKLASEIIEAHDARFTLEETRSLLDISSEVVEYALEHQEGISKVIIKSLQTIYPGKKIERPYLLRAELPTFCDVKQEAMQRAFEQLPWNATVVSYFLDVGYQQVQEYYKEQGGNPRPKSLKRFKRSSLTIFTASKVYKMLDQGLKENEIQRRLHQSPEVVDYALQHRSEIEPDIIKGLQVLFPLENISKPYR